MASRSANVTPGWEVGSTLVHLNCSPYGCGPQIHQNQSIIEKWNEKLKHKLYVSIEYINLKYKMVLLSLHFMADLQRRVRFREFQTAKGHHNFLLGPVHSDDHFPPHPILIPAALGSQTHLPSYTIIFYFPNTSLLWISSYQVKIAVCLLLILLLLLHPTNKCSVKSHNLLFYKLFLDDCMDAQSPQGHFYSYDS